MHEVLQKYFDNELRREQLSSYFTANFSRKVKALPPSRKLYTTYFAQGRQYLKNLSFPERKVLSVEKRAIFSFAGHTFTGFIDLLSEDADGKLYITDHKSRALQPYSGRNKPTKSDKELDSYLRQLYVYSAAVYQEYGRFPDYLEFNCFRNGNFIRVPFSEKTFHECEAWAADLIDRITANDDWWPCCDFWFCKHLCDVSADCEYMD